MGALVRLVAFWFLLAVAAAGLVIDPLYGLARPGLWVNGLIPLGVLASTLLWRRGLGRAGWAVLGCCVVKAATVPGHPGHEFALFIRLWIGSGVPVAGDPVLVYTVAYLAALATAGICAVLVPFQAEARGRMG